MSVSDQGYIKLSQAERWIHSEGGEFNVKDMLQECNIHTQLSTEIMDGIFGKKQGSVYVEGLVDAQDMSDFQEKVERLVESW